MDDPMLPVGGAVVVQMETTGATAETRPPRRRTSLLLVGLVVAALLTVGAGVTLARQASRERRDAVAQRDRAATELGAERDRNDATGVHADLDHTSAAAYRAALDQPMATAHQIDQLLDEQLPSIQILQQAGQAGQISTYNATVGTANANRDQYDATLTTFDSQLTLLPAP